VRRLILRKVVPLLSRRGQADWPKRFSLVGLVLIVLLVTSASALGAERRALLIGINDYASPSLVNLRGAVNDVELLEQILHKQYGFPRENLTILRDEQASRAAILQALRDSVAASGPEDFLYVHFSGHGAQVEDLNGDEVDGLDETLVAQDSRTEGVLDILDDEISELIEPLASRAVLIVDACHSGTITRGDVQPTQLAGQAVVPRSAPPDARLGLYREHATALRGGDTPLEERVVLMTGAAENQSALDGPVDGKVYGFFTYAFSKSLQRVETGASPQVILEGVHRELERIQAMHGRNSMPEPQLLGRESRMRQPLIPAPRDGAGVARLAWSEVLPDESGTMLLRGAGSLSAAPGSSWAIYPPGETEFPAGGAVAVAEVLSVEGADAVARWREGARIEDGARAIPAMARRPPQRIPIQLRALTPSDRRSLEEAMKAQSVPVSFVRRGEFARYVVDRENSTWIAYSSMGLEEVGRRKGDAASASRWLSAILRRSAKVADLLAIDNAISRMTLEVRLAGRRTRGIRVVGSIAEAQADLKPGRLRFHMDDAPRDTHNSLQLSVLTSRDCFLTLLDVDVMGTLTLLFPNALSEARGFLPGGSIRAGFPVEIPDSLASSNRAGFYLDFSPPAGVDTLRGFCHTHREDAERVRELARAGADPRRTRSRGTGDPTERVRVALRGLTITPSGPAGPSKPPAPILDVSVASDLPSRDWATATLNLEIGP